MADRLSRKRIAELRRDFASGHEIRMTAAEMMPLLDAYEAQRPRPHIHVASDDGDACGECGLDLRNEIHRRLPPAPERDGD